MAEKKMKRSIRDLVLGAIIESLGDVVGRNVVTKDMMGRVISVCDKLGIKDLDALAKNIRPVARVVAGFIPGGMEWGEGLEGFAEGFTNEVQRRKDTLPEDENEARRELLDIARSQKGTLEKGRPEKGSSAGKTSFFEALDGLDPSLQERIRTDIRALSEAQRQAIYNHATEAAFTVGWLKGLCALDDETRRMVLGDLFAPEAKKDPIGKFLAPIIDAVKQLFNIHEPTKDELTKRGERDEESVRRRKERLALRDAMRSNHPFERDSSKRPGRARQFLRDLFG